jgi:hypothetical protein
LADVSEVLAASVIKHLRMLRRKAIALMTETVNTTETSDNIYYNARSNISKDSNLQLLILF